jgi:hypothetical protein
MIKSGLGEQFELTSGIIYGNTGGSNIALSLNTVIGDTQPSEVASDE